MVMYTLATFESSEGPRPALVIGTSLAPFSSIPALARYASIDETLADWKNAERHLSTVVDASSNDQDRQGWLQLQEVTLLAPVQRPRGIYCAGANYMDHVKEMALARGRNAPPDARAEGEMPWHFIKSSAALSPPFKPIAMPGHSNKLDWEVELAAVIGMPAKDVSIEDALNFVAGYTVANDLSARDLSVREGVPVGSGFRFDWLSQKSFDNSCPLGPWLVPARFIENPQNLGLKLWVNDELKQNSNTREMIFNLAEQIAYLSSRITLHPGDLVLTGTPAGVGNGKGEFLKRGDVVKVWIERVGEFENKLI